MSIGGDTRTIVGIARPLDPLSRDEISGSIESFRFTSVELHEPAMKLAGTLRPLRALAKRCITDLHLEVCFGPWSIRWFGDNAAGRRLMRANKTSEVRHP